MATLSTDEPLHPGRPRHQWKQRCSAAGIHIFDRVTGLNVLLEEVPVPTSLHARTPWQIFYDTPVTVGAFGETDWNDVLRPFVAARTPVDGGRKEIANRSGGIPVLAVVLLERLADGASARAKCSKVEVDSPAGDLTRKVPA